MELKSYIENQKETIFTNNFFLKNHKKLWKGISNSKIQEESLIIKSIIFEKIYNEIFFKNNAFNMIIDTRIKKTKCFACGEAFRRNIKFNKTIFYLIAEKVSSRKLLNLYVDLVHSSCKYCPLNWGDAVSCEDVGANLNLGTSYTRWKYESNIEKRKIIAHRISNLEWIKEKDMRGKDVNNNYNQFKENS